MQYSNAKLVLLVARIGYIWLNLSTTCRGAGSNVCHSFNYSPKGPCQGADRRCMCNYNAGCAHVVIKPIIGSPTVADARSSPSPHNVVAAAPSLLITDIPHTRSVRERCAIRKMGLISSFLEAQRQKQGPACQAFNLYF